MIPVDFLILGDPESVWFTVRIGIRIVNSKSVESTLDYSVF